MPLPTIRVLGVYALPVTDDLVHEQTEILYGSRTSAEERREGERRCRELLESVVLVEVVIRSRDARFKADDFVQPRRGVREENWPVAYDEAYLSLDGETRLGSRSFESRLPKDFRVAFFIHDWDPALPLLSSYGEIKCPPVQPMSERLRKLVPFDPFD
jgi:hypothetical protein